MILIPDQPVFARDTSGQKCSFDLHKLNDDLKDAFKQHGLPDQWLVDRFAHTLEEKLRSQNTSASLLSESEINSLMSSVLTASGYADVAQSFTQLRGGNPMRQFLAELTPWDDARILRLISGRLPLTPPQAALLVPRCHRILVALGLSRVSDTFIIELAVHLSENPSATLPTAVPAADTAPATPLQPPASHLRSAAELRENAPLFTQELLDRDIIHPLPVPSHSPSAQLALSISRLCDYCAGNWPSELALSIAFPPVGQAVLGLLGECRHDIASIYPASLPAPAHVIVPDYQNFLQQHFPATHKKAGHDFDTCFRNLLHTHLQLGAAFDLILTLQ